MFSSAADRPAWCLLAFTTLFFLSYSTFEFWFTEQNTRIYDDYPESITAIFSTQTINAMNQDQQLHDALLSLGTAVAHSSTDIGNRFGWEHLRSFGGNLSSGVEHYRNKKLETEAKRGILEDIGKGITNALGSKLNLTGGIEGILSTLGNTLAGKVGTPALFLGIGLGIGTSTGLNLTSPQQANAMASRIASSYGATATGFNLAAQNLGDGLLRQILPNVNVGGAMLPVGEAAFSLASGIGNATAAGLGLTQEQFGPSMDMSIAGIAGNIGLGVTTPLVANLKDMLQNLTSSAAGSGLLDQLPEIAAAAGEGLGNGVKNGLGLGGGAKMNTDTNTNTNSTKMTKRQNADGKGANPAVTQAVESFTEGLTGSLLSGANLSMFTNLLGAGGLGGGSFDLKAMIGPIASGAGAGVGMGAAIGLQFRPEGSKAVISGDLNVNGTNGLQIAETAESLVENVLTNFLLNSSVIEDAMTFLKSNRSFLKLNFEAAQAAEGFGRGAIEGVVSAMSSVGGFKNLISGDIPANAIDMVPVLAATTFNDSINGAAIGLARGLTGKGTILVADIIKNLTSGSSTTKNAGSRRKRSISSGHEGLSVDKLSPLYPRQAPESTGGQVPIAIDASTAQAGGQKAVDFLNCQGIGGLASAALGVQSNFKNGGLSMFTATVGANGQPLSSKVMDALPKGPVNITLDGNTFEIIIQEQNIKVNGHGVVLFAVLTGLHVIFLTMSFFLFLPLYLIWGVVWRFSILVGYPVDEAKNRKWRMGFLLSFALLTIAGVVLGLIGVGNGRHFNDLHAIFGIIILGLLLPTVGLSIVRLRTTLPHPDPSAFVGFKGPIGVARSSQRIYFISSALIQVIMILGQFAYIRGFEALRVFSLCVVDAILNSAVVAGLMSFLLMIQISATALVGIRTWLEQRIAQKEAMGLAPTPDATIFKNSRTDTMQTFGFEPKDAPSSLDLPGAKNSSSRMEGSQRPQDQPTRAQFNIKNQGSFSEKDMSDQTLVSPGDRGFYSSKSEDFGPSPTRNGDFEKPPRVPGERRPSSGVFDIALSPSPRIITGPKTANVTTQDLFPPPVPESERPSRPAATQQPAGDRSSRPIDGNIAVRNSLTGFVV